MFDIVNFTPASDIAASGTTTVTYPNNRSKGSYSGSDGKHVLLVGQNKYVAPADFTLTFNANASGITLTWGAGKPTIKAGTACVLQMDRRSVRAADKPILLADETRMSTGSVYAIDLGSPITADADGVGASQSVAAATVGGGLLNGALVVNGACVFDVPRNVVAAWTGTAVLTVTGTDVNGKALVESSASGTSLAGKKAFKTVTKYTVSADVTSLTIGTGDVLGLPVALPGTGYVLQEMEDGAKATAGTLVAASIAKATATTGDVRGTYDPNSACDGGKGFVLIALLTDPNNKGVPQYGG